jgi:hypothetical protein
MSKTITYTTGVQGITDPSKVDGVTIGLAGTALATAPTLDLENAAPVPMTTTYLLGKVEVLGTAGTPKFGNLESVGYFSPVTLTQGVHLSHGTLTTGIMYSSFAFDGDSVVTDDSTLIAYGGRYLSSSYTLNGSIAVGTASTANFLDSHLAGSGTLKTTAKSATIDIGGIGGADSGIHVDLTKGGVLNLDNGMNFLGQIDMGRHATVNVNSQAFVNSPSPFAPLGAVAEVWHSATDLLELLNAAGQDVAKISFAAGTPTLYAASNAAGGVAMTEHFAAGDLPITVVHS